MPTTALGWQLEVMGLVRLQSIFVFRAWVRKETDFCHSIDFHQLDWGLSSGHCRKPKLYFQIVNSNKQMHSMTIFLDKIFGYSLAKFFKKTVWYFIPSIYLWNKEMHLYFRIWRHLSSLWTAIESCNWWLT